MKKLKVLLADPRHKTVGAHSYFVPIGIGYIGSNLLKQFKGQIDLKLFIDAEEIFESLENWKPDVIGISNYIWNSDLSKFICEYAKKINPNVLTILGGPEFPAGTGATKIEDNEKDKTYSKCFKYLSERPCVDYFAYSDGETSFLEIVKVFIENNCLTKEMIDKDKPIRGCVSLKKDMNGLHIGDYIPRIGMSGSVKNEGRDVIPSPYTTGLLDKFLDGSFVPAFETARGCPFLCTYCDQGIDATKIATFSVDRIAEEIEYVAKKLRDRKGTKAIIMTDSNWGIFEKDVRLSHKILKVMDKYDYPQYIECITPKSNWNNIIKINDKLKNRVQLNLSMQSLNLETLDVIKRRNWTKEKYIEFLGKLEERGKSADSEIIMPLPYETEKTYLDGIKFLMDNGVRTLSYTLMMLFGAELGRDKALKDYGLKDKWRILPKSFGEYRGKKVFEIERICVGTKTMDYQTYLNCRSYSFIAKLMGIAFLKPISILTKKIGISWFDLSIIVRNKIKDKNYKGRLKELFNNYCKESHEELFETKEEAMKFYSEDKNYKLLINGDVGENLMSKYTARGILILDDIISILFDVIRSDFPHKLNEETRAALKSAENWLKNLYLIDKIFSDDHGSSKKENDELTMDFDFPAWLQDHKQPLKKFKKNSIYKFNLDLKKINYIQTEIDSILLGGKDKNRAFARYLERRYSEVSFFRKEFQKLH
jgi:radical SAM superfamily enzyme YgiQ (UPF0313 family)